MRARLVLLLAVQAIAGALEPHFERLAALQTREDGVDSQLSHLASQAYAATKEDAISDSNKRGTSPCNWRNVQVRREW